MWSYTVITERVGKLYRLKRRTLGKTEHRGKPTAINTRNFQQKVITSQSSQNVSRVASP